MHTWTWALVAAMIVLAGCGAAEPEGYESGDEPKAVLDARKTDADAKAAEGEPTDEKPTTEEPDAASPVSPEPSASGE